MADQYLHAISGGKSYTNAELSDMLFGIAIPYRAPIGVFPLDPDFGYQKKREWSTQVQQYSPLISQRYIRAAKPKVTFTLGFGTLRGTFDPKDWNKNFRYLWDFFNAHKGRLVPFYFFDPTIWTQYDDDTSTPGASYKTWPPDRLNHPTDSDRARYICNFQEDIFETEVFEWKLRRSQLILEGYLG